MCCILIFVKNKNNYFLHVFDIFSGFFSNLPKTQTIKKMDFNPLPSL